MIIRNRIKAATFEQNIMNLGRCFITNHVTAGIATRANIPTNIHVITSSIVLKS
jgi:hypothetical protein